MRTIRNYRILCFGLATIILLTLACGAFPIPVLEFESTATVVKPAAPTSSITTTATLTETLSPAHATLTDYARQAEGTRQVLADTQVALMQKIDATATARALDATASVLAPLPSTNEQVEVQANVMWQDTGIQVRRGDTVKIRYVTGTWSIWLNVDPLTDGNGQNGRPETCRIMPEENLGGLIGRVGDNSPFFIGNGTEIYSDYNGTLQLSINDCVGFSDNGGALTVAVVIDR